MTSKMNVVFEAIGDHGNCVFHINGVVELCGRTDNCTGSSFCSKRRRKRGKREKREEGREKEKRGRGRGGKEEGGQFVLLASSFPLGETHLGCTRGQSPYAAFPYTMFLLLWDEIFLFICHPEATNT